MIRREIRKIKYRRKQMKLSRDYKRKGEDEKWSACDSEASEIRKKDIHEKQEKNWEETRTRNLSVNLVVCAL